MNVIEIMVTIIIVTILVTVVLGAASYAAYWLRRARKPAPRPNEADGPRYFYRYVPEPGLAARWASADGTREEGSRAGETAEGPDERRPEEPATVEKVPDLVHAGASRS